MCTFGINRQSAPAAVIPTLLDTGGDCCGLVTSNWPDWDIRSRRADFLGLFLILFILIGGFVYRVYASLRCR